MFGVYFKLGKDSFRTDMNMVKQQGKFQQRVWWP